MTIGRRRFGSAKYGGGPDDGVIPAILASTPIGYWPLNENAGAARDVSGNGRTGTAGGGTPSYGQAAPAGHLGVYFNNAPYFDMGDIDALNPTLMSAEGWVKITSYGGIVPICGKWHSSSTTQEWLLYVDTTGAATFLLGRSDVVGTAYAAAVGGAAGVPLGEWHHVAGTWDGTHIRVYVDGVLAATDTVPAAGPRQTNGTMPFRIGAYGNGVWFANATIAQVAVFNTALSSTAVAAHWLGALGFGYEAAVLADTPRGFWPLNEAVATAADDTGNARTGTETGTTSAVVDSLLGGARSYGGGYTDFGDASWMSPQAGASGKITLEAWINPTTIPASAMIFTKGSNASGGSYEYSLMAETDGHLTFAIYSGNQDVMSVSTAAGTISTGQWAHVVAVFDRAAPFIAIYINGVLSASNTTVIHALNSTDTGSSMRFGIRQSDGSAWNGKLSRMALYATVLTSTRVLAHYNAVVPAAAFPQTITTVSIDTAESISAPLVTGGSTPQVVTTVSIASAEAFGSPTVFLVHQYRTTVSIASGEAFGTPGITITRGRLIIPSASGAGVPTPGGKRGDVPVPGGLADDFYDCEEIVLIKTEVIGYLPTLTPST